MKVEIVWLCFVFWIDCLYYCIFLDIFVIFFDLIDNVMVYVGIDMVNLCVSLVMVVIVW